MPRILAGWRPMTGEVRAGWELSLLPLAAALIPAAALPVRHLLLRHRYDTGIWAPTGSPPTMSNTPCSRRFRPRQAHRPCASAPSPRPATRPPPCASSTKGAGRAHRQARRAASPPGRPAGGRRRSTDPRKLAGLLQEVHTTVEQGPLPVRKTLVHALVQEIHVGAATTSSRCSECQAANSNIVSDPARSVTLTCLYSEPNPWSPARPSA